MLFLQPPTEWDGGVGYITKDMIEKHCPPPAADVQVCTINIKHFLSKIPKDYIDFTSYSVGHNIYKVTIIYIVHIYFGIFNHPSLSSRQYT
jgi:hypothetical protein